MPVQYRTGGLTAALPDDKHSTGWCYAVLQPVRSLPLSSDPAGWAKTKGKDRVGRNKEKGIREIPQGETCQCI